MLEFEASTVILNILKNNTTFSSMLSTVGTGSTAVPMLIFGNILPQGWSSKAKTVNIYTVSSSGQLEYNRYVFRASCRGNTYAESRQIAQALHNVLNRVNTEGFSVVTTVQQTLQPVDAEMDNFNTPVTITVRTN